MARVREHLYFTGRKTQYFRFAVYVLALGAPFAGPALGQDGSTDTTQTEQTLAPIMVEGEKTTRTLQDTATSVSVLTAEDLDNDGGTETLDKAISRLPNVVSTGTGNLAPTIRGSDTTGPAEGIFAFLGGTRPRVTIQKDGRPLTYNEYVFGRSELWDVERIEVLRGPQTTLQGRNSIAGAIIVDTKDPTFEYATGGQIIIGNENTRQLSGVVSGPILTDELAFRLSADRREHQSYVNVLGGVAIDDPRQETATDIRGKLLYLPTALPDLTAKLTLNLVESRRPQTEFVDRPFRRRELDASAPGIFPIFDNQSKSAIVDISYSLTPAWELRNTSVYSDVLVKRLTDPGSGIARIGIHEYSNELIASYTGSGRLSRLVVGTYYFHSESDEAIDIGNGQFDDETDSVAVFGEGTVTFLKNFDLTVGGRYEYEQRERNGAAGIFRIDLDKTYNAFLPKVGLTYHASETMTYGVTIQRGFNAGGGGVAFTAPFTPYTYDEEYVWNYEAFFRSTWLNNQLQVNGNIFYADYKDQQRTGLLDPADPNSGIILNAEAAQSYGAELTVHWLPIRGLDLFGGLGLLSTEIERFDDATQNLEGAEFARAPAVNLTLGTRYEHPAGWSLGAQARYLGDYFSDDENTPAQRIDGYALVDLDAGYQLDPRTRVFAYVNNAFDSNNEVLFFTNDRAILVNPREFGLGVAFNFE